MEEVSFRQWAYRSTRQGGRFSEHKHPREGGKLIRDGEGAIRGPERPENPQWCHGFPKTTTKKEFQEDLGYGPVLEAAPRRAPQIKVMTLRADFLP